MEADAGAVQPSLLAGVNLEEPVPRQFDLGMDDFVDSTAFKKGKENRFRPLSLAHKKKSRVNAPPTKRPCLQSSENKAVADRFDFSKDDAYSEMAVQFVPKNTKKNNDWAYKNFEAWLESRNRAHPDDQCSADLLQPPWDPQAMAHWLPRFACETRNTAGCRYPASTIFSLLSGLLRRIRAIDPDCPNFLNEKDPQFREMHAIIDTYFRELRDAGVGAEVKHTSVISKEEENKLWEEGVIGVDTPTSLLRAVFYYNGKSLCLRGGKEHRSLKLSQIVRHHDPPRFVYTENGSKNRNGSFNQMRVENKVVTVFPCPEAGIQCHYSILEKYIDKLPPVAFQKDWFYLKPLGDDVSKKHHPLMASNKSLCLL